MKKIIVILFVILLTSFLFYDKLIYVDDFLLNLNREDLWINFFKVITLLGAAFFLIVLAIILVYKFKNSFFLFNLIIVFFINVILKVIVERDRPLIMLVEETGYSFPSGHAMVSAAFYGLLIYYVYLSNISIIKKISLIVILSIIILMISVSRVYLNVHYFTDVYFGLLFGLVILVILIAIKLSKKK